MQVFKKLRAQIIEQIAEALPTYDEKSIEKLVLRSWDCIQFLGAIDLDDVQIGCIARSFVQAYLLGIEQN